MAINFPNNPTLNQTVTVGTDTWYWNGTSWEVQPVSSPSFTNLSVSGTISGTLAGNVTGNVTGTVSDISNHSLEDLGNISSTAPTNGQVLSYNLSNTEWEPVTLTSTFTGGTVPNPINIISTAVSSSSSTGALVVAGGAGIAGNLNIDGDVSLNNSFLDLRNDSALRFYDATASNFISIKAPTDATENVTYILPTADGDAGQVLQTNGSGVLTWATVSGGAGGATPPGGSNTQVQFNNAGVFGGTSALTYNSGTQTLTAPNVSITGNTTSTGTIVTSNSTQSTSSTTGSIRTSGGIGVAGQINVAGSTNKFTGNTESTSTTTGTLVVTGGVGVSGSMYVGSTVTSSITPTNSDHLANKAYVDANVLAFSMAFGV